VFSADSAKTKIRGFFGRYFRTDGLRDDEDVFASGRISSMVAMELVLFLEKEFGVKVENEDLRLDNFRTVDAIAGFSEKKLGGKNG